MIVVMLKLNVAKAIWLAWKKFILISTKSVHFKFYCIREKFCAFKQDLASSSVMTSKVSLLPYFGD